MNKFSSYNTNFWACDFETTTKETQFYAETGETKVWLAHGKRFHPNGEEDVQDEILTVSIEEFFEEFFKRKESATLFFHNLAFDGEFIKWYLVRNGFKYFFIPPERKTCKGFVLFEDDKNIYHINVFKPVRDGKKKKIVQLYIRCSMNLLQLSIEKLAKAYKLPHKESINYHVEPFEKIEDVPYEFISYIKTDVNIMIPPLIQFNQVFTHRLGNREVEGLSKLTIGSVSLSLFKAFTYNDVDFRKELTLPYEDVINLLPWYSGGLTTFSPEYQYKITDNINGRCYDVNSMYPSVMVEGIYPYGEPVYSTERPSLAYKIKLVKIFIKHAKIKNPAYPPLMKPWRSMVMTYEKGARFITETKMAMAYYFADELESLQRFYDIDYDVVETIWFKAKPYFRDFISKHYDMRKQYKETNDPRQETIKLLLNSAYGKFGQKPDRTSIIYSWEEINRGEAIIETEDNRMIVDTIKTEASCINGLRAYTCYPETPPKRNVNVAIAACVTKNARMKLYDAIYANLDNFLYCDTDSIFVKEDATGIEIDEHKLGAWKLEMTFDGFELGGAKLYNLYVRGASVKSAHAGISAKWAKRNLKPTDIITIDKKLDKGSKISKKKVKGGIIIEESEFTIKKRS